MMGGSGSSGAAAGGIGVEPYWELTFDADGDPDAGQRDRLLAGAARQGLTDLLVFAHGWNNDRSMATRLYGRFFAPFPAMAGAGVRLGYAGVIWPAMRFTDEPIPDFDPVAAGAPAAPAGPPLLEDATLRALARCFPGRDLTLRRVQELLAGRPAARSAFDEYARLVRDLVSVRANSPAERLAEDMGTGTPAMLTDDPLGVCEIFTAALEKCGQQELFGDGLKRLWNGAREFLRQSSYYGMKRRSGVVGQLGLGPVLGALVRVVPGLRVHLVGHSFGARLVSYALRGMPPGATGVKSVTLLQGAFSHYAFAARLPHDPDHGGALRGVQQRVDGPMVACYSRHDSALSMLYPLASKLSGDSASFLGLFDRWGAIGHDGIQAVDGARNARLGGAVPDAGCVSIDASPVVRTGPPPAGAHSDICHRELARVVLGAGRVVERGAGS
ncbi:serine-threonine protein kinase [Streptomyces albofaciens JCM 4342]|uniref:serine-threonine protein kinase n=1 Tax=Streptomyces albofaciens TaxID=66866 RepID=UPI001238DD50|nr:serine-threonine protein kinase [Streptomyces albofaciens]KAA6224394.1 serine-threonine protein kinase [Streptomyces albofaciens JCM 4342]